MKDEESHEAAQYQQSEHRDPLQPFPEAMTHQGPQRGNRSETTIQSVECENPYILPMASAAPAQTINITAVQPTNWITLRAAAK